MDAREHYVAEGILAALAIALTAAVLVGSMFSRTNAPQGPPATDRSAAAPSTTAARTTTTVQTKPTTTNPASVVRAGFEADLAGWRPIGAARIQRDPRAHHGQWAARFDGPSTGNQGIALPAVLRCKPGKSYAATVWLQASRPGALLQVNLLEYVRDKRYATDTVGTVLGGGWQRVEVAHLAHRPDAILAFEVVLPHVSPPVSILVDELEVTVHKASFMSDG